MNRHFALAALVAIPAVAFAAIAQEGKKPQDKPAAGAEMGGMPMPQPTPHHARIKDIAGHWDWEAESTMGPPGSPPTKSKGTETNTSVGEFWNVMDVQGEFFGMKFHGHGWGGYDTAKKKHVGAWIDNFGDYMMVSEGDCDGTCKVETLFGEMRDPAGSDAKVKLKQVHEWVDKDNRTFTMFTGTPDGKWDQHMKIAYKRKK